MPVLIIYLYVVQEKLAAEIQAKEDFYDILGVERTATEADLKKSYRKVRKITHQ